MYNFKHLRTTLWMIIRQTWHCLTLFPNDSNWGIMKLFVNLYISISIITGIVYVEKNDDWSSGENDHSQMMFECLCMYYMRRNL